MGDQEIISLRCSENWDPIAAALCCTVIIAITFIHTKWLIWV